MAAFVCRLFASVVTYNYQQHSAYGSLIPKQLQLFSMDVRLAVALEWGYHMSMVTIVISLTIDLDQYVWGL